MFFCLARRDRRGAQVAQRPAPLKRFTSLRQAPGRKEANTPRVLQSLFPASGVAFAYELKAFLSLSVSVRLSHSVSVCLSVSP